MARARNIKPGFYANEDLAECSVWARFIFPGLWMLADREGRLEDRPKRIKGELLRYDSQDVEPLLAELAQRGFIVRYQKNGVAYIQISKFHEHQSPHYSEKQSVIPPPDSWSTPRMCRPPCVNKFLERSGSSAPMKTGSQPPDSLIPDSLIPEEEGSMSGSPPADPDVLLVPDVIRRPDPKATKAALKTKAKGILEYLNERAGKRFQPNDANLDFIVARMVDGATEEQCRDVICDRVAAWVADPKMRDYLRPETLFNRTKFNSYVGSLGTLPDTTPSPFDGAL